MKYLVKTVETEIWNKSYIVEANSEDEATQIVKDWDINHLKDYSENYIDTSDIEILEIEPYNEN